MALSAEAIQAAIDGKTKPPGSLGAIETLAAQLAALQGTLTPKAETCHLTIFAGDHGIAAEGVSPFPQAVTGQMVLNFLGGGAAATVFARTLGTQVTVVDAGVLDTIAHPYLIDRRMGPGTANSAQGPAMSAETLEAAIAAGLAMGAEGVSDVAAFGEMGIANTSAAALVASKVLGLPVGELAGRGTGWDDDGLKRKIAVLERAAARTEPKLSAKAAMAEYGGFEMAMMAGAMVGAAQARRLVLVDGFIATASAMLALELAPEARNAMAFAHRSAEAGHAAMLEALGADPLLDLGLRLGEGTGGLLAWPLVQAAAAMLTDMASFESAGVSGAS